MKGIVRHTAGTMAVIGILVGLSGCDWWPPALQERIGAQEAKIKGIEAEKAAMQTKVAELMKATKEFEVQVAQVTQANVRLRAQVDQLAEALQATEAKMKKGKPAAPAKK